MLWGVAVERLEKQVLVVTGHTQQPQRRPFPEQSGARDPVWYLSPLTLPSCVVHTVLAVLISVQAAQSGGIVAGWRQLQREAPFKTTFKPFDVMHAGAESVVSRPRRMQSPSTLLEFSLH